MHWHWLNVAPDNVTADGVAEAGEVINREDGMRELQTGSEQSGKMASQATQALGIDLS